MKLKIIVLANIITIIVCLILSGLYFVSNPGGFYVKSDGFLPSFEYTAAMSSYKHTNGSFTGPVTIATTDRSANVCVGSYADYDKDLVMGNYQDLETIQFSEEEINSMATITIDDIAYTVNNGIFTITSSLNTMNNLTYEGDSMDAVVGTTFYYLPSNPTRLYTSQYLNTAKTLGVDYDVAGFFTVDQDGNNEEGMLIQMTDDIEDAIIDEHIKIYVPFQIEEKCIDIEPNSTYVIDSTGGRYE